MLSFLSQGTRNLKEFYKTHKKPISETFVIKYLQQKLSGAPDLLGEARLQL